MQRVIHSRSIPWSPAPKQKNSQETLRPTPCPPTRPAPQVPRRKTSLQKVSPLPPNTTKHRGLGGAAPEHERGPEDRHAQRAASSKTRRGQSPLATPTMTPTPIAAPVTSFGRKNSYPLSRTKQGPFVSQASSSPTGPPLSPSPSGSSQIRHRNEKCTSPTTRTNNNTTTSGNRSGSGSARTRTPAKTHTERGRVSRGGGRGRGAWPVVVGDDAALVALTPVMADVRMMGGHGQEKAGQPEKRVTPPVGGVRGRSNSGVGSGNAKVKKENRKDRGWSWASWWQ
jgi:hypothetical protein